VGGSLHKLEVQYSLQKIAEIFCQYFKGIVK
jgi:hypothetical protein